MEQRGIKKELSEAVLGAAFAVHNALGPGLLELKSVKEFSPVMYAQAINYLRLSGVPVGYLINFNGCRVEWNRFVWGSG